MPVEVTSAAMRGAMALVCLLVSTAAAEPDPPTTSYRGQVIASDAVAAVGFLVLRNTDSPNKTLAKLDVVLYLAGGPFIHGEHQQGHRMLASAGLRLGLPFLAGGIGYAIDDCPHCAPGESNFAYGLLVGGLAAMILDETLIATPVSAPSRGVLPAVTATRGGATFGVAGWY